MTNTTVTDPGTSDRHRSHRRICPPGVTPGRLVLAALALLAAHPGRAATLESSTEESAEGYYQLSWQAEEPIRLVEAEDASFSEPRILYAGADSGRVVSGKPNGRWYYRLEAAGAPRVLSETVVVTVRHHSLGRAFGFFALGAIVFAATLALIAIGSRRHDELG
jgi:hypothetical protein